MGTRPHTDHPPLLLPLLLLALLPTTLPARGELLRDIPTPQTPPPAATATATRPIRVMAVGDSITQGIHPQPSYRKWLHRLAEEAGTPITFVGSASGPCKRGQPQVQMELPGVEREAFPQAHEGHCGWATAELRGHLRGQVRQRVAAAAGAEVILLHIGTNDVINVIRLALQARRRGGSGGKRAGHDLAMLGDAARNIVNISATLASLHPGAVVFVATLVENQYHKETLHLNGLIAAAVRQAGEMLPQGSAARSEERRESTATATSPPGGVQCWGGGGGGGVLCLADLAVSAGFSSERHTSDSTHPNTEGERVLAAAWMRAVGATLRGLRGGGSGGGRQPGGGAEGVGQAEAAEAPPGGAGGSSKPQQQQQPRDVAPVELWVMGAVVAVTGAAAAAAVHRKRRLCRRNPAHGFPSARGVK